MITIPFVSLSHQHEQIRTEMERAFQKTMEGGHFVLGSEVKQFEKEYAAFNETPYCVSVGNGLDALICALMAIGIKAGDEVIVPSHTCYATWLAVDKVGARPVPVEVHQSNFTMDENRIESAITSQTKAILPVHLYGFPCRMDRILEIAKRHGLSLVEDNAQAHGARYQNKLTGSWGDVNATSFYPTKNLGALGDGGAVTTHRQELAEFIRSYRNYGAVAKDVFSMTGINSRLDELQASLLLIKLRQVNQWNEQRKNIAAHYHQLLRGVGDISLPPLGDEETHPVFHLFVITTEHRNALQKFLGEQGIGTAIHYPVAVHQQKAFEKLKYKAGSLPIAEKLSSSILSLPIWPGLTREDQERVAATIKTFFDHL